PEKPLRLSPTARKLCPVRLSRPAAGPDLPAGPRDPADPRIHCISSCESPCRLFPAMEGYGIRRRFRVEAWSYRVTSGDVLSAAAVAESGRGSTGMGADMQEAGAGADLID